jgi:hypothetical protein
MKKFLTIFLLVVVVLGAVWFAWHFYCVFGEGVKAGQLNNFMKKAYVFKTYEGRLIQTGFQGEHRAQSNRMNFVFQFPVNLLPPNSWQTAERNLNCIIKNIWAHCPGGVQRFISWTVFCQCGIHEVCLLHIRHKKLWLSIAIAIMPV